jgi:glyoxylase-like metal-dependent hydrolase (beta-lactamase superfamily II)
MMPDTSYSFKIGTFDCRIIEEGLLQAPGLTPIELTCLFIKAGKQNILIDAGEGKGIGPTSGNLPDNLRAAGISPESVDKVIITHAHIDHVGGLADDRGKPIYPNARIIIYQKEWDWCNPALPLEEGKKDDSHTLIPRKRLTAVKDQIDIVGDEVDIVPGIKYVPAPGHTLGNAMVRISSGKEQILCVGDVIHDPAELTQPDKWVQFDKNPEEAIRSRDQILSQSAATQALVFVCHFPFPSLGHIAKKDGQYVWQPIIKKQRK